MTPYGKTNCFQILKQELIKEGNISKNWHSKKFIQSICKLCYVSNIRQFINNEKNWSFKNNTAKFKKRGGDFTKKKNC